MSNNDTHLAETEDLSSRLRPDTGWVGLVVNPAHPNAVPVILHEWLGVIDSLTWARHAVESKEPSGHNLNLTVRELYALKHPFYDDDTDWAIVAAPLTNNPTPHLIAVALVALQTLGVQVGREAVAHGIDHHMLNPAGAPFSPDPTVAALWGWVRDRWTAPPQPDDYNLRPNRLLHLNLQGEAGLHAVLSMVLHIARVVAAGRSIRGHLYVAMHPQLATEDDRHYTGPRKGPADPR